MTLGDDRDLPPRREPPAFNAPGVVLGLILVFVLVHVFRVYGIGEVRDDRLLLDFAFIPGCYAVDCVGRFDRAAGAGMWSPLTHAFLHGDWTHLGLNTLWLLAFGTPVARRLGAASFLVFSAAGALAGAGLFYLLNPQLLEPVIGASGVVSALMGGACRFAFGSLGRLGGEEVAYVPRMTIGQALGDRTILLFIVIFFATNLLTASSLGTIIGGGSQIAWEAHLGGFAFGFLGFGIFDRRGGGIYGRR